jgi:hypothetical protein
MKSTYFGGQTCDRVLDRMDAYLDRELPASDQAAILEHVNNCAACSREVAARTALRTRVKAAVHSIPVSPMLSHTIQQSIRAQSRAATRNWTRTVMAVAAAAVVCIGFTVAYEFGHFRLTRSSQEAYIASVSSAVTGLMRVGLGNHVHCAVYGRHSENAPSLSQMSQEIGPEYKDLIDIVKNGVPDGYRVITAHQCRYHARRFVHVVADNGRCLMSLIIAHKRQNESFTNSDLAPILSQSGIPIYQTGVQRFNIAAFETKDMLVYVVSDMGARQNAETMAALAASIRAVLRKTEV